MVTRRRKDRNGGERLQRVRALELPPKLFGDVPGHLFIGSQVLT
ncbi:hypothetical protein [Streptomyces rapamycinicus]|uniref:Transposase n=1 Tax=Streptomyces rapamycinicus TaxID=1226757 RepID=A0ABR6M3Y7_9ACTN|nr:hypothetical protein [Streptomyces rapamycinicus]AGP59526.1 hypothetical protein M271_40740 [Streptomyces rapamycinicus NRRL 5491]MBB4789325.1 hypothetical protein [Streptomyces rapamycinicus]